MQLYVEHINNVQLLTLYEQGLYMFNETVREVCKALVQRRFVFTTEPLKTCSSPHQICKSRQMFKFIIAVAALAVLTTHVEVAARSRQSRQAKGARWWDNGHMLVGRSRPSRQASTAPWWETIGNNPEGSEIGELSAVPPPPAPAGLTSGPASSIAINDLSDLASLFGEGVNKQQGGDCECVPYYQCKEGVIITDGEGVIDIRFGNTLNDTGNTRLNSHSQCQNFLDVCCQHPNTAVIPGPGPVEQYLAKCGRRNPTGVNARVSGFTATQAQFGEFPWMAAILQTEYVGEEEVNLYVCGGSLIYPDVVLTAAHCVQSWQNTPTVLKVRLGEWDTQRTYELYTHVDRRVSKVIANDKYNPGSLSNDFAILLLETPVALTNHIDTICLPDVYKDVEPSKCFVTGWGKNEFGKEGEFQNILKKVSLPLVSHYDCEQALRTTRLGKYFNLHSTFTCAGGGVAGQDACNGDGGSPLVCPLLNDHATYVQVGIVAWGIGCGEAGIPGVYADVTKGITWVNQELAKLPNIRTG